MNRLRWCTALTGLIAILIAAPPTTLIAAPHAFAPQGVANAARAKPAAAPTKTEVLAAARDVMSHARYATLSTVAKDGQPQARIVDPLLPDKQMTVWIGTNALTRKIGEVRANPKVTLLYFDSKRLEYVSLLGTADVITDKAEKAKHWKTEWGPFYKKGTEGDDFALIRVRAMRIEVVSPSHKLMNDTITWRPVAVNLPQ